MAGNWGETWDVRLPRADLVLWMDLPSSLSVWRIVTRSLKIRFRGQIDLLPENCRTKPDMEPLWDYPEFILYTWRFRAGLQARFVKLRKLGLREMILLASPADVSRFRNEIETEDAHVVARRWLRPLPAGPAF